MKNWSNSPNSLKVDLGTTVWHNLLHRHIFQHNIRVVSKYYKQIRLDRSAQLLQLDDGRVEQEVLSMVSDGGIYAKSILLVLKCQPTCIQYAGHYACANGHKICLKPFWKINFSNF
ncbi:hypothetical protein ACA910_014367 [Epithemia clementina (nom. ined.)]